MAVRRPGLWRRGLSALLFVGVALGGCNGLFGIEDATVTPGAGGDGGLGGAGGSSSGSAGKGGGTGGTGGGMPGGSAGAPSGPFDTTFGDAGVVIVGTGGPSGGKASLVSLGHQQNQVFLAGEIENPSAPAGAGGEAGAGGAAPPPDRADLFFARLETTGAPDAVFGGFLGTPGLVYLNRGTFEDRLNAVYIDPATETTIFTQYFESPEAVPPQADVNARLLADGSKDNTFASSPYSEAKPGYGSSEELMRHAFGGANGYLIVRCNENIDFQTIELHRFESGGSPDATLTYSLDQMPTRINCKAKPLPKPDGQSVCIALAARDYQLPADSKVGAGCLLVQNGATNTVTHDTGFNGTGSFLFTPPAPAAPAEQFYVRVYDLAFDAQGRLYESFVAGTRGFIVRLRADGSNVDDTFGSAGLVDLGELGDPGNPYTYSPEDEGPLLSWCLQVDAAGSVLWGGRDEKGKQIVRRFADNGSPATTFGTAGSVELPATFAPRRCALDSNDRLVVAGPTVGGATPTITVTRLRND